MTPPATEAFPTVRLEAVTSANRRAVLALKLLPAQRRFLASNAESLAEARGDDEAIPRAIVADERVAGFLMYSAPNDEAEAILYRFMIDRREQGRGLGRAAIAALLAEIGRLPHIRRVDVCYEPDNAAARRLYARCGFREKGLDEDDEMIATLELAR